MSTADTTESLPDVEENLTEVLSRPIEQASLFYALYWLVEVQDESRAAYDFSRRRDRVYDALRDYVVWSCLRELSNLHDAFLLKGETPSSLSKNVRKRRVQHLLDEHPELSLEHEDVIMEFFNESVAVQRAAMSTVGAGEQIKMFARAGEDRWQAFSRRERFLETLAEFFNPYESEFAGGLGPEWGWAGGFGGPAWAAVAEHGLREGEVTKIVFINQSWALEHNNANWMDKLALDPDEGERIAEAFGYDSPATRMRSVVTSELQRVLEWAREGDMDALWPVASTYTDKIEINLRRFRFQT